MNRNCSGCNIMIDISNYRKDRTVCKSCCNKNKRKNNNIILTPNIENVNNNNNGVVSTYENHRHVFIGSSNVRKTSYMLKVLEKMGNKRPIQIITRSISKL